MNFIFAETIFVFSAKHSLRPFRLYPHKIFAPSGRSHPTVRVRQSTPIGQQSPIPIGQESAPPHRFFVSCLFGFFLLTHTPVIIYIYIIKNIIYIIYFPSFPPPYIPIPHRQRDKRDKRQKTSHPLSP